MFRRLTFILLFASGCGSAVLTCRLDADCPGGGLWSCDRVTLSCHCAPKTCITSHATCGVNLPDGCGGTIASCGGGLDCGGGPYFCDQSTNRCACRPNTCASLGATCGSNLPD